jgi:hypothetical protein
MIDALDEVLRQLLIREIPIRNGEVEVAFDLPNREWSARLNRPTLNLFLYDVRENTTLRRAEWEIRRKDNGKVSRQRSPVRVDLHYMITAWAKAVEDEHRMLTRALMALFRHPTLPNDLLPEIFNDQPVPIPMRVAQQESLRNPAEVWNALDNDLRPAINCTITVALKPFAAFEGPLVRTRELRWHLAQDLPSPGAIAQAQRVDEMWAIGGRLRGAAQPHQVRLTLLERGQPVAVDAEGIYRIANLTPGDYTLLVEVPGQKPVKKSIRVPSASYDIEVKSGQARGKEVSKD